MEYINELIKKLKEKNISMKPCTDSQLEELISIANGKKLTEGDNPPIYFYNEDGEDKFVKIANSLTEFLIIRLEMNEKLFKPVD